MRRTHVLRVEHRLQTTTGMRLQRRYPTGGRRYHKDLGGGPNRPRIQTAPDGSHCCAHSPSSSYREDRTRSGPIAISTDQGQGATHTSASRQQSQGSARRRAGHRVAVVTAERSSFKAAVMVKRSAPRRSAPLAAAGDGCIREDVRHFWRPRRERRLSGRSRGIPHGLIGNKHVAVLGTTTLVRRPAGVTS